MRQSTSFAYAAACAVVIGLIVRELAILLGVDSSLKSPEGWVIFALACAVAIPLALWLFRKIFSKEG